MSTLLDIKNAVAEQLGVSDGSTPNTIRDRAINRARSEFYASHPWSFLKRDEALVLTVDRAPFPSTLNSLLPIEVYAVSGGIKYEYGEVPLSDIESYDGYVYALDHGTGEIVLNRSDLTPRISYYSLPVDAALDGTADSTAEPTPDITPIVYLAISKWWLASERSNSRLQLFKDYYQEARQQMLQKDMRNSPVIPIAPLGANLGYNGSRSAQAGYRRW